MKIFENPFPTKKDFVFKNPFSTKEDILYPIGMLALFVTNLLFDKSLPSLILLVWGLVGFGVLIVMVIADIYGLTNRIDNEKYSYYFERFFVK